MRRALVCLGVILLLGACSKEKGIEPPAELVDFKPQLDIKRVWSVNMGGGDDIMRYALAPQVAGGVAYLAGHGGDVVAVGLENGKRKWSTDVKFDLSAGPGVGDGLVAVGSANGQVAALDAASGKETWRAQLNGEVLARPAIGGGMVVVHTVDGRLHGLQATDGREAWSYEQPAPRLSLRGTAPPVIAGDMVICGLDNGKVAAIELSNGDLLWSSTVSPPSGKTELARLVDIDSAVSVIGDDIFAVGFQGRVAMLARESGQIWWARDMSSYRGLAAGPELLYVSTAEGSVVALSQRDGTERWRQAALRLRGLSAPAIDGNAVVVGDFEGYLHWLDATTGEMLGRERAGGDRITNAPLVADGLLLVEDDDGKVSAYRAKPRH